MTTMKFLHLRDRRLLKVSGEDARNFLQGLLSNDLMRVSERQSIYAALLTPQGKYLHDFFISELNKDFYLDCEAARINDLYKRLKIYKLRSKIDLDFEEEMIVAALFGAYLDEIAPIQPSEGSAIPFSDGILYVDPRLRDIGGRAMIRLNSLEYLEKQYNLKSSTFEEYDTMRITFGLPDGSRDLIVDKSILLESGFEELNGIDFDKGCYIGQELTARTKHRGLVKKRLTPVQFKGNPPNIGTKILQDQKEVGEIRSASGSYALALLRVENIVDSEGLQAGDADLVVHKTDWANF